MTEKPDIFHSKSEYRRYALQTSPEETLSAAFDRIKELEAKAASYECWNCRAWHTTENMAAVCAVCFMQAQKGEKRGA